MHRKVLIVGDLSSKHIFRLVRSIKDKKEGMNISIDAVHLYGNIRMDSTVCKYFENIYVSKRHFGRFLYKVPVLRYFLNVVECMSIFSKLKSHYNIVNIQYITYISFFLWKYYKNISDRIIITPWGSDVYRVKNIKKILCASCLRRADYVIVDRGIKFESDLLHMYNLDRKKFLYADFGSDIIDLFDKNNITKKEAKFFYNVEGYYVITCGYNANPAQNHKKVIEAIYLIRDKLPENLALFLPMTYGNTVSYKEKITETLESCGFKHVVFSKYMSDKEVLYMKKATDLYINVQNTDAFSSSLQEYILSGTKIINGGWLRYPTIEKFGLPYFVAPDLDSLSDVILKAYNSPRQNINAELINYISSLGWKSMSDDWINIYNNY